MASRESMVRLYRAPDAAEAAMLVHVLESDGIPAKQVGGSLRSLSEILVPMPYWVEVWVPSNLVGQAQESIEKHYAAQGSSEAVQSSWTCRECGEENDGSFQVCWSCQAEQPK